MGVLDYYVLQDFEKRFEKRIKVFFGEKLH